MMKQDAPADEVAYFGYGSLVNEFTWARPYEKQVGAIDGWIREWKHCVDTPFGKICALTVAPRSSSRIRGLFIKCDREELKAVDDREIGYERTLVSETEITSAKGLPRELYIYKSTQIPYRRGDKDYPLFLSYVEVVILGYFKVFGEAGVDHFISTTTGWDTPVFDDRDRPLYPRVAPIEPDVRLLIESK